MGSKGGYADCEKGGTSGIARADNAPSVIGPCPGTKVEAAAPGGGRAAGGGGRDGITASGVVEPSELPCRPGMTFGTSRIADMHGMCSWIQCNERKGVLPPLAARAA